MKTFAKEKLVKAINDQIERYERESITAKEQHERYKESGDTFWAKARFEDSIRFAGMEAGLREALAVVRNLS